MEPNLDKNLEEIEDLARFPSENPNPVIRANFDEVLYTNQSGQKLLEIQKGCKIPEFLKEYISESLSSNKIQEVELPIKDQIYSFAITPIKEKTYVNIYGKDITERKKSEKALLNEKAFTETALNAQRDTFFVFDPSTGTAIRWNNAFNEASGYTDEEILKLEAPVAYYNEKDLKELAGAIKLIEQGKTTINEVNLKTKDGNLIPFEYVASGIFDNDNNLRYIVAVGRNVTERKIAEQKAQESEEKFRQIFEAIPDLYFLVSGDNTIIEYSGNIRDLYLSPEEFLGKKIQDLLPIEVAELNTSSIKNTLKTKEPQIVEYDLFVNNEINTYEARHLYLSKDRVSIFIRDITKRKRAERQLKESEEKYRVAFNRANFYKDLFAHDMNNVFNSILLSVEFISETPKIREKMDRISNMFNIIKESSNRGARLISNVQKLSRLEDTSIIIENVDICNFLKDAISFVKNTFPNKEIKIQVNASAEHINANGNELLLDVFENIMINAIRYNKNEIKEIMIHISETEEERKHFVKIEFLDNGIGIEHFRKDKIFEIGNREYKGGRGMGLGLSLVKKIVESYGGKIMVEDKVPGDYSKGCNFIVIIPKSE